MPRYDYMNLKTGEIVERTYSMTSYPRTVRVKGKVFHLCIGSGVKTSEPGAWPQVSRIACFVPAHQQVEAMQKMAELGCPTDYVIRGHSACPVWRDRDHRNRFMKATNRVDLDAGYGDRSPNYKKGENYCVELK